MKRYTITVANYPPNSHYTHGEVSVSGEAASDDEACRKAIEYVKSTMAFAIKGERFEVIRMEVDGIVYGKQVSE